MFLNLKTPTAPENYVDREFASGTPLNWQDDITGKMRDAVMSYLYQKPTPEQLKTVISYLQYHIHAPCWLEKSPFDGVDNETANEIRSLREQSLKLESLDDVNLYINAALDIALDPL